MSNTPIRNGTIDAKVAPTPSYTETKDKAPLQIAVQLLKRHRDVTFQDRGDAPISIIITTLAAKAYQQEPSVLATLRGLLDRMPAGIDYSQRYARIANPTNEAENFADKWRTHPEREKAYYQWNSRARDDLRRLEAATGIQQVRSALIPFFGERRTDLVLKRVASTTAEQRNSGLKVDAKTGLVGVSTGVIVPKASFYGDANA